MYGIINYIMSMLNKYNNIFDYYVYEVSHILLFYQFVNLIILLLFFGCLIFNFFLKRYTIKTIILFLFKRFFFVFFIFFSIYYYSDFSMCETHINKTINNSLNTDVKKYVFVTGITITAGFLLYKFIPICYNKVYNYNNNIIKIKKYQKDLTDYNFKLDEYNTLKDTLIEKEKLNFSIKYNQFLNSFKNYTADLILLTKKFKEAKTCYIEDVDKQFGHIKNINHFLKGIKTKNSSALAQELSFVNDKNIIFLTSNLNDIDMLLENTLHIEKVYKIDVLKFNEYQQIVTFYLFSTRNTYQKLLFELMEISGDIYNEDKLIALNKTLKNLNFFINESLKQTNMYNTFLKSTFITGNTLLEVPVLNLNTPEIVNLQKPINCLIKPLDFGDLYLEGLKLTGINLSYIFFYPTLYCSNKIFGTVNPLSSELFKEALWYFITFKIFF